MQDGHSNGFLLPALLVVGILLATPPALAQGSPGMPLAPGDRAPVMKGNDAAGEFRVVDYSSGKITLINFWATWCVPCREELPMLQRMHEEFGDAGMQIVAVTYEDLAEGTLEEFAGELGLEFPLLVALPRIRKLWVGVQGALPNSYLIDGDGRVMRRYVGAAPEQIAGMERDLRAAIEGRMLETMVMPEKPAVSTSADRPKTPRR